MTTFLPYAGLFVPDAVIVTVSTTTAAINLMFIGSSPAMNVDKFSYCSRSKPPLIRALFLRLASNEYLPRAITSSPHTTKLWFANRTFVLGLYECNNLND